MKRYLVTIYKYTATAFVCEETRPMVAHQAADIQPMLDAEARMWVGGRFEARKISALPGEVEQ